MSLPENPYTIGSFVKLAFLVDRDLPAFAVDEFSQEIIPIESSIPGESFFARWVAGNVSQQEPAVDFPFSYFFGYQSGDYSILIGSNGNGAGADEIHVTHNLRNIADWAVGMTGFEGQHRMMLANSSYAALADFDLTLVSISQDMPAWVGSVAIPEPGSLAMLGMGFLCLGAFFRRRSA